MRAALTYPITVGQARPALSARLTEKSLAKHTPVPITYALWPADQAAACRRETTEYLPEPRPLEIPRVDLADLPLSYEAPLKALVFIPTYNSQDYIRERIAAIYEQGQALPPNWTLEILVVLNGSSQYQLWNYLTALKTQPDLGSKLSLAFVPREENPAMLQSKTTPMNIALTYAREKAFDVFCAIDDDTALSPQNLLKNIRYLQEQTLTTGQPVLVGPEIKHAPARTFFEKVLAKSGLRNLLIKGCNMFLWSKAAPLIPVDAGNEDFLLVHAYGERAKFFLNDQVYGTYRVGSTFLAYIKQNFRLKWNDSTATQYLDDNFSLWQYLVGQVRRLRPPKPIFSIAGLCHFIIRAINLYVFVHVKASIVLRNIFNLPRGYANWVGTADPGSKSGI